MFSKLAQTSMVGKLVISFVVPKKKNGFKWSILILITRSLLDTIFNTKDNKSNQFISKNKVDQTSHVYV